MNLASMYSMQTHGLLSLHNNHPCRSQIPATTIIFWYGHIFTSRFSRCFFVAIIGRGLPWRLGWQTDVSQHQSVVGNTYELPQDTLHSIGESSYKLPLVLYDIIFHYVTNKGPVYLTTNFLSMERFFSLSGLSVSFQVSYTGIWRRYAISAIDTKHMSIHWYIILTYNHLRKGEGLGPTGHSPLDAWTSLRSS